MSTRTPDSLLRTVRFLPYLRGRGPSFTLKVWDTYTRDHYGKSRLAYQLTQHDPYTRTSGRIVTDSNVIFEGADFCCAPGHAIDSDDCVVSLMGFLTLRPGDTDSEYFENYTAAQKAFCESYAETLGCEVSARFCDENGEVVA